MFLSSRRARVVFKREPVARPHEHAPATFVCPGCDVVLSDGAVYSYCPMCNLPVDWVDLNTPVWCCPDCDAMFNGPAPTAPRCQACDQPMVWIDPPAEPFVAVGSERETAAARLRSRVLEWLYQTALTAFLLMALLGPLLSLALDPQWRYMALALAAPALLVPITLAGLFLWTLGTSLRELRDLVRDRRTRIIHGLEHAAATLLVRDGEMVYGGLTHPTFFELHLSRQTGGGGQAKTIRRSVQEAIRRIRAGERRLAFHPRCGTSILVTVFLVAVMAVASAVIGFFMHLRAEAVLGTAAAFLLLIIVGARPLGLLAQRFFTVSTDLRSARVVRIIRSLTGGGDRVCYNVYLNVRPG